MRKIMIIISACLFTMTVSFLTGSIIKAKEKEYIENIKDVISVHLDNAEYSIVYDIYNKENQENKVHIDEVLLSYADTLCKEAYDSLNLEKIIKFKDSGGNYQFVLDTIMQIEMLLKDIEESNRNFNDAIALYNERNFDESKKFEAVIEKDSNYEIAQEYLTEIRDRTLSWDENIWGANENYNAVCYDGEYMYIPFVLDGIDGIYKINSNYEAVVFFPLSDEAGTLVIKDINSVGDYLYFIAGENVGSGYTFNNPYSVYEMKKDGTGLCVVLEGNFTDLYIKEDKVYALSREYGLIEYDRNFDEVNTISSENVIEFSVSDTGIYYVVQGDLTHDSDNSLYFYDGNENKLLDTREYLHMFGFGDEYVQQWQYNDYLEAMFYYTKDDKTDMRNAGIYNFYGRINDQYMYSCVGSLGREIIYTYDIQRQFNTQLVGDYEVIEYQIVGILYEHDMLIIKQNNTIYFTDSTISNRIELATNSNISNEILINNSDAIMHTKDEDIYLDEGQDAIVCVIADKQIWHYKDDSLNITTEKRYVDEYDCNVYVTHIYTKDYSLFTTGNANTESLTATSVYYASDIAETYNMIYAQNTDTFLYDGNSHEGIIIRQGEVVRDILSEDMLAYFDDGSMEIYRYGDDVSAEMLIEKGATVSFSFGPVLVDEYQVNLSCVKVRLANRNPRSAIGYVEPGHYVFIVSDGRDNSVSRGLNMIQLARLFEDEGCYLAYNLDGGMTTTVLFMGNYITHRPSYSSGSQWFYYRRVAELMYFGTSDVYQNDLSQYVCTYDYFDTNYK